MSKYHTDLIHASNREFVQLLSGRRDWDASVQLLDIINEEMDRVADAGLI